MSNKFKNIWNFFDRKIILPITKFFVGLTDKFDSNGKKFEKFLSNKNSMIIISLVLAFITFYFLDLKSTSLIETSAEIIYNQPITATYNEEAYVIEGLPETVDVTLIGRKSDLYLAKQLPSQDVTIDLSDLKPGVHKVNLKYKQAITSINYKLDPSTATIVISQKVSETKNVAVDILNRDKLDTKLFIQKVELERDNVIIKGSEEKLASVAAIKALIDVNNLVSQTVGTSEIKDVPLAAYDSSGKIINVEIVPAKINADIVITSPSKDVPIVVVPKGNVVFGKAIATMDANITRVTIYGDATILESINSIPVEIDVTDLKNDKEFNVTIKKPVGIREISAVNVNIKLTLGDEVTREINDVYLESINLNSKYNVQATNEAGTKVTVIVKGVQSVIDALDVATIKAYVDLKGYNVGEHEVDVITEGIDLRLTYLPKVKKVTWRITNKN